MEKYNKVYVALWLLFSAIILSFTLAFVHGELGEILDNDALSFFLLFFISDIVGFIFASLAIDRLPSTYNMRDMPAIICLLGLMSID
ncbi:MAG TPA: hypothetical protein VMS94_06555 [Acidobacteriota bacterium]|jgi:hypothetical protein|nr:hypothetical protein [Acidobacteriota bacterium]